MTFSKEKLIIRHYTDPEDFKTLEPYWNTLLKCTPVDDPFLTWEWQSAWWQHYGENNQMWLLGAWENDKLVGIAPLMRRVKIKRGVAAHILCVIGQWDIDHGGLIVPVDRPDVLEAFGRYLAEHDRDWDILNLCNCYGARQDLQPFFNTFHPYKFNREIDQSGSHYYIPLDEGWKVYYSHLSRNLRRELEDKYRRARKRYKVRTVHLIGTEITSKYLEDFFYIGLRGRYPGLYADANDRSFHQTLVEKLGPKDWIELSLMYLDEKPVAYNYGFIYQDRFLGWRMAFDPVYSNLSPGSLIMRDSFEFFFSKLNEIDFLRGNAAYKKRWASLSRKYIDWQIVSWWRFSTLIHVRFPDWKECILNFLKSN